MMPAPSLGTSPAVQRLMRLIIAPNQDVSIDPTSDPEGYRRLLGDSADERRREDREAEDQTLSHLPDMMRGQSQAAAQFNRMQQDAAIGRNGYNRSWVPFFEAPEAIAENTGKSVRVQTPDLPASPRPNLPAGYTQDQFDREIGAFKDGGAVPSFATNDTLPSTMNAFRRAMASPSLRALGQRGGY